jgi:hypothetical protein
MTLCVVAAAFLNGTRQLFVANSQSSKILLAAFTGTGQHNHEIQSCLVAAAPLRTLKSSARYSGVSRRLSMIAGLIRILMRCLSCFSSLLVHLPGLTDQRSSCSNRPLTVYSKCMRGSQGMMARSSSIVAVALAVFPRNLPPRLVATHGDRSPDFA